MSSVPSSRSRHNPKYTELCIGGIDEQAEANTVINYFQKFGNIVRSNFTSTTGGFLFLTYEHLSMVEACMTSRPHFINGRRLYVKRSLPVDDEHPHERFETTRELMIVFDFDDRSYYRREFYIGLQEYFSSYGKIFACEYCQEENFRYILIQLGDRDNVDRIILDKPHTYYGQALNVMKYIKSNIELMNVKYASKKRQTMAVKGPIDNHNQPSTKTMNNVNKKEPINEGDLENEVYRLQNTLTKMNEHFTLQRKELEDSYSDQSKNINESIDKIHRSQQDLEQALSAEYESIKQETDTLNEYYLSVELENFELTSYYDQILAEEKAKTIQLEEEYQRQLKAIDVNPSSPFSSKSQ